jgi:hypothetical protein
MILVGQVIDSATSKPIEFAKVYISNISAKPIIRSGYSAETDSNGRFTLNNVTENDFISTQMVSYETKIVSVKKALTIPNGFKALLIKLNQGKDATLPEVKVTPKDEKPKTKITTSGSVIMDAKTVAKPEEKVKEPMKLWVKIALGVGAVTVLGIIIFLATKNDKKGKK